MKNGNKSRIALFNIWNVLYLTVLLFFVGSPTFAGKGIELPDMSKSFSGKVYLVRIGIDTFSVDGIPDLSYSVSDSKGFFDRMRKDSSFVSIVDFPFSHDVSLTQLDTCFATITRQAETNDLFVFYSATMSSKDGLILSDGTVITAQYMHSKSNSLRCSDQLYFIDGCSGREFANLFQSLCSSAPEDSRLLDLNRVILTTREMAYESSKYNGGILTQSYVQNQDIYLLDLFKTGKPLVTLMYKFYQTFEGEEMLDLYYFSEGDYATQYVQTRHIKLESSSASKNEKIQIEKAETLCLLVACDYFGDGIIPLSNPVRDIRAIREKLEGYAVKLIYLENPSLDTFRQVLTTIKENYEFDPKSQFFFWVASHGIKDETENVQIAFSDSYLDGTLIKNGFTLANMKMFVTRSIGASNTLIMADICEASGAISKVDIDDLIKPRSQAPFDDLKGKSLDFALGQYVNAKTNLFFSSSRRNSANDGRGSNSPFAKSMIQFLNDPRNFKKSNELCFVLRDSYENRTQWMPEPYFCTYWSDLDSSKNFLFIRKKP